MLVKKILMVLSLVIASFMTANANAACTKPSGLYAGSGAGESYTIGSGLNNVAAISLSVSVNSTQNTIAVRERAKYFSNGGNLTNISYSGTLSFSNSSTICGGIITTPYGSYAYNSSDSGKVLDFIYFKSGSTVALFYFRLQKV